MFQTYTIALFGNRFLPDGLTVERILEKKLSELAASHEHITVLIGRNGDFDLLASSVVRRLQTRIGRERCTHVLVLLYPTKELRENKESYAAYYDEIRIDAEAQSAHFKTAITVRNRRMIDESDLVLVWAVHPGGADDAYRYAKKQNIAVYNIAQIANI